MTTTVDTSDAQRRAAALEHAHHSLRGALTALVVAAADHPDYHQAQQLTAAHAAVVAAERAVRAVRDMP